MRMLIVWVMVALIAPAFANTVPKQTQVAMEYVVSPNVPTAVPVLGTEDLLVTIWIPSETTFRVWAYVYWDCGAAYDTPRCTMLLVNRTVTQTWTFSLAAVRPPQDIPYFPLVLYHNDTEMATVMVMYETTQTSDGTNDAWEKQRMAGDILLGVIALIAAVVLVVWIHRDYAY